MLYKIEEVGCDGNINAVSMIYDYGNYGNLTSSRIKNEEKNLEILTENSYDNQTETYIIEEMDADGKTIKHTYNESLGLLASTTNQNGIITNYGYNDFNRLESVSVVDDNNTTLKSNSIVYNSRNRIKQIISGSETYAFGYDAFRNNTTTKVDDILITTNTYKNYNEITNETNIGHINPIRYRGYYYDKESRFYYLNSRYYDPEVSRFINADDIAVVSLEPSSIYDKNLYSYCDNNPVTRSDSSGDFWDVAFDIASLLASINDVKNNPNDGWAWAGLLGDAVDLLPIISGIGESAKILKSYVKSKETLIAFATKANVNDMGKIGESLSQINKNKVMYTINGLDRIPDGITKKIYSGS